MKPTKIVKTYRLPPKLIERMKHAAEWLQVNETDVVEEALDEYLTRFERQTKRQKETP